VGEWGGYVASLSLFCLLFDFRSAGGGEVSGGGTLYMKWGADNKLSQARFTGRENFYFIEIK
jgi:hypothetical protein